MIDIFMCINCEGRGEEYIGTKLEEGKKPSEYEEIWGMCRECGGRGCVWPGLLELLARIHDSFK